MSILKVARLGHPVLREAGRLIEPEELQSGGVQQFIDDMIETMREYDGVGLAAPQVHEPVQILVYELAPELSSHPRMDADGAAVLVNPVIEPLDEQIDLDWEGCLSIPDLRGVVPRHASLKVRALGREGETVEFTASGFEARVIQHETDHVNGIVFLDRMPDMQTLSFQQECQRYWMPGDDDDLEAELENA